MLKIKASNITNLTDARYFAAKEVAWLGFNFEEGAPQYIDPMKARAMFEWVEGPQIVGRFAAKTAEEVRFYAENWGLTAVQVSADWSVEALAALAPLTVILEVNQWSSKTDLTAYLAERKDVVSAFELNFTQKNECFAEVLAGSASLSLEDIKALSVSFPLILNIDMAVAEVAYLLPFSQLTLNLVGGEEERVGVKSFDDLDEIFDILEPMA